MSVRMQSDRTYMKNETFESWDFFCIQIIIYSSFPKSLLLLYRPYQGKISYKGPFITSGIIGNTYKQTDKENQAKHNLQWRHKFGLFHLIEFYHCFEH